MINWLLNMLIGINKISISIKEFAIDSEGVLAIDSEGILAEAFK